MIKSETRQLDDRSAGCWASRSAATAEDALVGAARQESEHTASSLHCKTTCL
jgi:hypothetical protein